MTKNNEFKLNLPSIDDLFSSDQSRADEKREKVSDIQITEIDSFPDHPFKVTEDDGMRDLVKSIKLHGVMTPVIVRQKENGHYELISGHRRKKACEIAGIKTVPAIIRDLSSDEAIISMVDANLQREVILPSEKAFSYKMRLEAMNRQGQRSDLTYSPLANKLVGKTSSEELAETIGTSKDQIFRYIRLTELVSVLLQMVDEKQIGFRSAVELSYLKKEEQESVYNMIQYNLTAPTLGQARKLKQLSQDSVLTEECIQSVMFDNKQDQTVGVILKDKRFYQYFPKSYNNKQKENLLVELLEKWYREMNNES